MEPDDAVDLLEELSETNELQAQQIINALPDKEKNNIETLLAYEEGSAGSIMTSNHLTIPENLRVEEALAYIKKTNPPESELSFYIFIISKTNKLIGYTTLRDLVFCKNNETVSNLRHEHNIYVNHFDDQETVAKYFQKYDMSVLPVINEDHHLLGAITIDDVVDVVIEEANEDIYKLTGTSIEPKQNLLSKEIFKPVLARLPWLTITILGGLIASSIINVYSNQFTTSLFPLAHPLLFLYLWALVVILESILLLLLEVSQQAQ